MLTWKLRYRSQHEDWSLDQFVKVATALLVTLGIEKGHGHDPFELKDRLVRYYTSGGAVTRPGRKGKEVRYGYEHLVQVLATRQLLNDGWPLAKVASFIQSTSLEELEAMLPDEASPGAQHRSARSASPRPAPLGIMEHRGLVNQSDDSMNFLEQRSYSMSASMQEFETRALRNRVGMAGTWQALGHEDGVMPAWREAAAIDLTSWCRVVIDVDQLRNMHPAQAERIGEALAHAVKELRTHRRERK
jgi:DNA-binding transcriptional MerR regulator